MEESLLHLITLTMWLGSALSCQFIPAGHGGGGDFHSSPPICLSHAAPHRCRLVLHPSTSLCVYIRLLLHPSLLSLRNTGPFLKEGDGVIPHPVV